MKNEELCERIARMQEICLKPIYSCNGELIRLIASDAIKPLLKCIKQGNFKLSNEIVFNKDIITFEELFIYNLDKYCGYIRDNYLIDHIELILLLEFSFSNKYSKILLLEKDFHSDLNYVEYYLGFKRMFLFNIYNNIKYYAKNNRSYEFRKILKELKGYDFNNNDDIEEIENIFIKIINNEKDNLIKIFFPYKDIKKSDLKDNKNMTKVMLHNFYFKNNGLFKNDVMKKYTIKVNNTTMFFKISKIKKKLYYIDFGISNNSFNAKVKDITLSYTEIYLFLDLLKNHNSDDDCFLSFIDHRLRMQLYIDRNGRDLDIYFYYSDINLDYYIICLDDEEIDNLYKLIKEQL